MNVSLDELPIESDQVLVMFKHRRESTFGESTFSCMTWPKASLDNVQPLHIAGRCLIEKGAESVHAWPCAAASQRNGERVLQRNLEQAESEAVAIDGFSN